MAKLTAGAPPQHKLSRASHIGPWRSEDYRSFRRLCNEALKLEPPEPGEITTGLLGWRPPSSLRSISNVETALRRHAVYKWIAKNVNRAVDTADDQTAFQQFRRARIVVEHIATIGPLTKPVRIDKLRKTAARAVERLEESINKGTLWFPNPAREEMLEELLAEAKQILQPPQRRPKSAKHPSLENLALELLRWTGRVDHRLLLQVVTVCNLECDEQTARRYVRAAKQRFEIEVSYK